MEPQNEGKSSSALEDVFSLPKMDQLLSELQPHTGDNHNTTQCKGDEHSENEVRIMMVTRVDQAIITLLHHIVRYCLHKSRDLNRKILIIVDELLKDNSTFCYDKLIQTSPEARSCIKFWSVSNTAWCSNIQNIDCVLTLGGDGTILYAIRLFRNFEVPPLISFNLGSMGFLTVFNDDELKSVVDRVLNNEIEYFATETRSRLDCFLYRDVNSMHSSTGICDNATLQIKNRSDIGERSWVYSEGDSVSNHLRPKDCIKYFMDLQNGFLSVQKENTTPKDSCTRAYSKTLLGIVLNDAVLDRGTSPLSIQLLLHVDGMQVTVIQADGIIVSTPTGSTAYSLSSGGSLVHPDSSVILITPICTHALSFRPIIIPDTKKVMIQIPDNTRTPVDACFDGRSRIKLYGGDNVIISKSLHSIRFLHHKKVKDKWFIALRDILNWNARVIQKTYYPLDHYNPIIEHFTVDPESSRVSPSIENTRQ